MLKLRYYYESFITRNRLELSDANRTYLWLSLKKCDKKISRFYLTAKMHNTPLTMIPVVSISGTMIVGFSKWLDHCLQKLRNQVPTYLKDSSHLTQLLKDQVTLPPGAKIFTADDKSMYINIYTDHGTRQVVVWMEEYQEELLTDSPIEEVKEALKLVMQHNIFEFRDCFFST